MPYHHKKYNILTIIRNPVGGIRTYIKYTYGNLNKDKYQFTLVIAKDTEKDSEFLLDDLSGFDVNILEIKGKRPHFLMLRNITKILRKHEFDLIHSHGYTSGLLGVIANYFFKIPHIITSHDVIRNDQFPGFIGRVKKKLISILLAQANILQSVGNDAQANLIEHFPNVAEKQSRLVVIKNGIAVEQFKTEGKKNNSQLREEFGIRDGCFLFGFLGRFMPQKGFNYLIEAVEKLACKGKFTKCFKILALNDGDYIREYKKTIHERQLSDYFLFHGFVADVGSAFRAMDALIMPSLWEAYSLLPMEALVVGCPVIATDCIGLREVTASTPALVVEARNSQALSEAMSLFMEHPDRIRDSVKGFVPEARERFDVQHTVSQLDHLFTRIICPVS